MHCIAVCNAHCSALHCTVRGGGGQVGFEDRLRGKQLQIKPFQSRHFLHIAIIINIKNRTSPYITNIIIVANVEAHVESSEVVMVGFLFPYKPLIIIAPLNKDIPKPNFFKSVPPSFLALLCQHCDQELTTVVNYRPSLLGH